MRHAGCIYVTDIFFMILISGSLGSRFTIAQWNTVNDLSVGGTANCNSKDH